MWNLNKTITRVSLDNADCELWMLAADSAGRSLDTQAGKKEPWTKEQEQEQEKTTTITSEYSERRYIYIYPNAHAGRRERDADRKLKRFATTTTAAHLSHLGLASSPSS